MANVGDRVLGQWEPEWFYPAVVLDRTGDTCVVQFDDGARGALRVDQLRPFALSTGSRVFGNWQCGGSYYPGRITSVVGNAIVIDYDDGDKETTTVGLVRVSRDDA